MEEDSKWWAEGSLLSFITCSIETNHFSSSSTVISILVNFALIFFFPNTNLLACIHLLGLSSGILLDKPISLFFFFLIFF